MHEDIDVAGGSDVLPRHRKNPTSQRQHQAFPPADPWSRGPEVLSVTFGPGRDRQLRGDASASDAQLAHSFFIHDRESMR